MQVIEKLHKAKIENKEITLLDRGKVVPESGEKVELNENEHSLDALIRASREVQRQNDNQSSIKKLLHKEGEEFTISLKYIVQ